MSKSTLAQMADRSMHLSNLCDEILVTHRWLHRGMPRSAILAVVVTSVFTTHYSSYFVLVCTLLTLATIPSWLEEIHGDAKAATTSYGLEH